MGDQMGTSGDHATFVPPSEVQRLLGSDAPAREVTETFATLCRINALGMIHLAGSGHIGSTFSSLDVVSWLVLEHLDDQDVYFSSKGHDVPGFYAVMLGLGRLDWELATRLRRLGGLPGHPDVRTPGVTFNTGSLGMGISKAKGLVLADRLSGRERRVVVMTGDGELQEGQIWESLATASRDRMGEITVVVDHNRLQSDMAVAKVSDLGDLEAKFAAFGWSTARCDGHDLGQVAQAFAHDRRQPHVVIAETRKGAGVTDLEHTSRPADERFYPFHSGALPEDQYQQARDVLLAELTDRFAALRLGTPALEEVDRPQSSAPGVTVEPQRLLEAYGAALTEAGRRDERIVVLDADLMVDCQLVEFADAFPDRFVECGIAEQDMVSQAGGLAAGGMLPVVNSFASFLSQRPAEQIANNDSEGRRVVYMGALAGLVPAAPGHSHQATRDIATFGSLEGVTVIAPSTERQVTDAVAWATTESVASVYLRMTPVAIPVPFVAQSLPKPGHGTVVHAGDGTLTVVAYGPVLLTEAWHAITGDPQLSTSTTLIDLPWVSDPAEEFIAEACSSATRLVVLDDHWVRGGLGERFAARAARRAEPPPVSIIGIEGLPQCGRPNEVLAFHRLDRDTLRQRLEHLLAS